MKHNAVIPEVAQRLSGTRAFKSSRRAYSWVRDISLIAQFRDERLRRAAAKTALLAVLGIFAIDATAQSRRERPAEETPEQYPAGQHRDDTFYFCTACHGFKIIAQQGMSRERWNETFDVMTSRHGMADVQGEQRDQMLDYLSQAFPERRSPGGWKNPFDK